MPEEKLKKIIFYIEKYRNNGGKGNLIDYYKTFDLEENDSVENLKKQIKTNRFKILFHPDLIMYIPDNYKEDFTILSDAIKDMENVFSDFSNKKRYDEQLLKEKNIKNNSNSNQAKREYKFNSKESTKKRENLFSNVFISKLEMLQFDAMIKQNIKQYGFAFTYYSIYDFMFCNYSNGFTRNHGIRSNIEKMGQNKIYSILKKYDDNKQFSREDLSSIVYYFSSLVNKDSSLKVGMDSFLSAIVETISKYDELQAQHAIYEFISSKDFNYFTNNNNARYNLKQNVNDKDGKILLMMYLSQFRYVDEKYNCNNLIKLSVEELSFELVSFLCEEMNVNKTNNYNGHRKR